jgi:predicted MFS family arabinose efflux permease
MANAGIGLGAIIGGAAIDRVGVASIGYIAAAIAVAAVLMIPFIERLARRRAVG